MNSNNTTNLREVGAFGVRVLSRYSGKELCHTDSEYRLRGYKHTSILVKSQLAIGSGRVRCEPPRRDKLNVWGFSPLVVHYGSHPLTGVVSHPVYKPRLTAPTGRGVTKRPA